MPTVRSEDVLPLRMASLLLGPPAVRTPHDIVTWFGAMQAQDLASAHWSFGVRIPGSTVPDIEQATADRLILRTWPMRGTVHFVPPEDAKWMLELTGVRALAGAAGRRAQVGLTEPIVNQAVEVLRTALSGGNRMTRGECVALLIDAGVHTASQHGYHLLWYASQIGVTCIGPQEGNEQTFVLLHEWVPKPNSPSRDEALAMLALRYFRSHGPTTRQDFAGWTGLTATDAKRGIEGAGDALVTVSMEGVPHVLAAALLDDAAVVRTSKRKGGELLLLPGFDEYILGFKDRTLMVPDAFRDRIVPGNNGVFMPTMVDGGRVIGTWKRTIKKARVDLQALPFEPLTKQQTSAFQRAGDRYAQFLQLECAVVPHQGAHSAA